MFKKQWIVVQEIPILEIEHIEKFGNELSVTWKGVTYTFVSKEKTDLFSKLVGQVNGVLDGACTEPPVAPQTGTTEPPTETKDEGETTDATEAAPPAPVPEHRA